MKKRNPRDRFNLYINKTDKVLEVGGGHNPHPRANVVVDKFLNSNYHRSGDIKILKNQEFIEADGESLPFKDKEFDYVISCQVLEHVSNPETFLKEQMRVARRGYIETPSLLGEHLFPKESHKWLILEISNTLVLKEKDKLIHPINYGIGEIFLHHLPRKSIGYKILQKTYPNIETVRYEWEDTIDYIINPADPELLKFFSEPWTPEMINKIIPDRTRMQELRISVLSVLRIFFKYLKNKF